MPKFGERSLANLAQSDKRLQRLFREVIKHYDCTILEGHRMEADQNRLFDEGKTKLQWPDSKHNKFPSMAVDVMPYPIDWEDDKRNYHFAGFVMGVAAMMGIPIRQGVDWDGDRDISEHKFQDLPHYEVREPI